MDNKVDHMLWTIASILIILWLMGLMSRYAMGGFIHVLLVLALTIMLKMIDDSEEETHVSRPQIEE